LRFYWSAFTAEAIAVRKFLPGGLSIARRGGRGNPRFCVHHDWHGRCDEARDGIVPKATRSVVAQFMEC
jgi:hypothetical protein